MGKKKVKRVTRSIVVGHLEKISSRIFERYPEQVTGLIKGNQGVYALYRRRKLYYVGLASDLKGRIKWHLRDRHKGKWDRFSLYIIRKTGHIREVETLLLRIAEPAGNKQRGRLGKSRNLVRELDGEVRRQQKEERIGILGERKGKSKQKKRKKRRKRSSIKGVARPLKGLLRDYQRIYCSYKGNNYRAMVLPNGVMELIPGKQRFDSPSMAGKAIVERGAVNGWRFWKFKDKTGELVPLSKLRK